MFYCRLCFIHNFSEPNGKKVVCGDWKLNTTDTYEQTLPIIEIINHPNFDGASLVNDIAVIKVSGSFNCVEGQIFPACLPNEKVNITYEDCHQKHISFIEIYI